MHRLVIPMLATCSCATLPQQPVQRGLYQDARQIVETEERLGWQVDRLTIGEITPAMLMSLCQVEDEQRLGLLDWLDQRIEQEGGPAEEAWLAAEKDLGAISELLTLERIRATLEHADDVAADDCPFYMEPDPNFRGRQVETGRFLLIGESFGGLTMLIRQDGTIGLGGGGSLRLLAGYGFSSSVTAGIGLEGGGTGAIDTAADESGDQQISVRPMGGVPVLFRLKDNTMMYDFELAGLTQYYQNTLSTPGLRAAFGLGFSSIRIGDFMPTASGFLAYEFYPAFRDLPAQHGIRLGTKVGINLIP